MKRFEEMVPIVKALEVGETGDGRVIDEGGLTRWGISTKGNPDVDVENLTWKGAQDIYYHRYWVPSGAILIWSYPLALAIFDWAVNAGLSSPQLHFQEQLNKVPRDGVFFKDHTFCQKVKEDARIGTVTAKVANALSREGELHLFLMYMSARMRWYSKLPTWGVNGRGWTRRFATIIDAGIRFLQKGA